jgi:hypothetical protein
MGPHVTGSHPGILLVFQHHPILFVAVLAALNLPPNWQGNLWHYRFQEWRHTMHHHEELEFNLVTRGSGIYLLDNVKYAVRRGDLIWLYPAQNHVRMRKKSDLEMWIGVFRPEALTSIATDPNQQPLCRETASGECCRRLPVRHLQRLDALLTEVHASKDQAAHFNAGLGYAFLKAWHAFEQAPARFPSKICILPSKRQPGKPRRRTSANSPGARA